MPSRRTRVVAAALAAAGLLAITGCSGTPSDAGQPGPGNDAGFVGGDGSLTFLQPAERGPAPTVRGNLLDGSPYDLADLRGKVVVVNVWGSWCGPCIAEAETLQAVYQATRPSGVEFVGVNVKDQAGAANAFVRRHGLTYPSFDDSAGRVSLSFRELPPNAIPTTLVLDRDGRVAARFLGGVTADELRPVVDRVAGESTA